MCFNFCISSLFSVPVGLTSSAVRTKICAITSGIKKYKPIIKEKKNKHDKITLLGKTELDDTEILISKVLIDPYIRKDEFASVLRKYNEIKKETWNFCGMHYINDGILWLNEKHIEKLLDHEELWEIMTKYNSNRKNRYKLLKEPQKRSIEFWWTTN